MPNAMPKFCRSQQRALNKEYNNDNLISFLSWNDERAINKVSLVFTLNLYVFDTGSRRRKKAVKMCKETRDVCEE